MTTSQSARNRPLVRGMGFAAAATLAAAVAIFATRHIYAWQYRLVPFTMERVETYYRPDGQVSRTQHGTVAIRSDGSHVEILSGTSPDGRPVQQKRILNVASRMRIVTDGMTDSVTTYHLKPDEVTASRIRAGACQTEPGAARREALGFSTLRSITVGAKDGAERVTPRTESWVAPDLNCFPLEETLILEGDGGVSRVGTIRKVVAVRTGEPDPTLFAIPPGLTERPPSEVLAEYRRRYESVIRSAKPPAGISGAAAHLDPAYSAARAPR